jgi:hypothetical protein
MRWLLLLAAGCQFKQGVKGADAAGGDGPDAIDAPFVQDGFNPDCFGTRPFSFCLAAEPSGSTSLSGVNINTGSASDNMCESNGGFAHKAMVGSTLACVLGGNTLDVTGGTLTVTGSLPVVLVARGNLTISGYVYVGSDRTGAGNVGPGANWPTCDPTGTTGATSGAGGGGGAGGSFGGQGGSGGNGNGGNAKGGTAAAVEMQPLAALRGGCSGAAGGDGQGGTAGGSANSGGAIFVITRGMLTISGEIDAAGEGGEAGSNTKGGGGAGGSGGMIVLAGATIVTSGALLNANGGGGGGGADGGNPGTNGGDVDGNMPNLAATGGPGGSNAAGNGGAGAAGSSGPDNGTNGNGGGNSGGGGGGGGGFGVIHVLDGGVLTGATVSPAPI